MSEAEGLPSATLTICLGSSCFTRGNDENLPRIQEWLEAQGRTGEVLVRGSRCEGRCQQGPNIRVGEAFLPEVAPATVLAALERAL